MWNVDDITDHKERLLKWNSKIYLPYPTENKLQILFDASIFNPIFQSGKCDVKPCLRYHVTVIYLYSTSN